MNLTTINIDNFEAMVTYLLNSEEKEFIIPVEDNKSKELRLTKKRLIINIPIIVILNRYNFIYKEEFFLLDKYILMDTIYDKFTNVYNHGIMLNIEKRTLMDMKWDFWNTINWINNFIMINCQEHHKSISIHDLINIKKQPQIEAILNTPIDETSGIKNQEKQINVIRKNLVQGIQDLDSKNNPLKYFLNLHLINETQIAHIFHMIGFRTDINDSIIKYLNKGNYLEGLRNPFEYVLESLSAKKALVYNKIALPDIQYFNRKQQLAIFGLKTLYEGDCGTNETISMLLTKENYQHFFGKNIVEKGKFISLTESNIGKYIGKLVDMRSVLKCVHVDGVCEACSGNLIKYFIHPDYNIGHNGCISFTSSTVQNVLSSKHFQVTKSLDYVISDALKPYFKLIKSSSNIFLRSNLNYKDLKLGFAMNDCNYIMNLKDYKIKNKEDINETHFGKFRYLSLIEKDTLILDAESLKCNNQFPKLTKELIIYIYQNFSRLEKFDQTIWIPLDNFVTSEPIFNCTVINDSIIRYVKRISTFLEKDIKTMTTTTEALNTLLNILNLKSNVNIVFIELIIKSYAVNNAIDFSNISPDTAKYYEMASIVDLNKFRSIGVSFAFERLLSTLLDPRYYLVPRNISPFDYFLGFDI